MFENLSPEEAHALILQHRINEKKQSQYAEERKDFKKFIRTFYKKERQTDFIWNWHYDVIIDDIIKFWEDPSIRMLIINIPPGTGKTEIILKLFPVWILGNYPLCEILAASYNGDIIERFAGEARDYYTSDSFLEIFPSRQPIRKDQNAKKFWKLESRGKYYAQGTQGGITGERAHLFLIDDPNNPRDIVSKIELESVNDWFSNVAVSRLFGKNNLGLPDGKFILIQQRIHDNDLTGYLIRRFPNKFKNGSFRIISMPAIATKDEKYRKEGDPLFPQMYPKHIIEERMEMMTSEKGQNYSSAQYQQNPVDVENAEFKREFFHYCDEKDIKPVRAFMAIDPAVSEKKRADYSAIAIVLQDEKGYYYVVNTTYGRWNVNILIEKIFALHEAYSKTINVSLPVIIETISAQKVIAHNIREAMKRNGYFFHLKEIGHRGEKESRIRSTLHPLYTAHRIYHINSLKWGEYEEELVRFPKSQKDDVVDAVETAIAQFKEIQILRKKNKKEGQWKKMERNILDSWN